MDNVPPPYVQEFMTLLLRHQRKLYQLVHAMVPHPQDAEDVLQETFVVLWQKFGEFSPGTNFYAWASRVILFEVQKYRHRLGRKAALLDEDVLEQLAIDWTRCADEWDLRGAALEECLQRLRPADRDLIMQRYSQEGPVNELAQSLNRSVDSIYTSLARIRNALGECINRALVRLMRKEWPS